MRRTLKAALESALLHGGPAALGLRATRSRALVLAYHNIIPHGEAPAGERALHLPRAEFAAQLEQLASACDVVPLIDLFRAPARTRPRAAITFDDAYLGAVTEAADELGRRGLPATFFVAPGLLGGRSFWWDDVAGGAEAGMPAKLREALLIECGGRDDAVRLRTGCAAADSKMPLWARSASEAALAALVRIPGCTLASHTWDHPNLAAAGGDDLACQLDSSLAWLRAKFPAATLPWLTYPYGLASNAAAAAAAAAGYTGAFRVDGGWLDPEHGPGFTLPRLNVPANLTRRGFALRLAGLLCR